MELSDYTKGRGADVSRVQHINKSVHYFLEPNNFYQLKYKFKPESLNFVYSRDIINETKFFRILIKEWFYLIKVKGNIIIDFKPNKILDSDKLVEEIKILLKDKVKIIKNELLDNKFRRLVIQKIELALNKNDKIERWTFGIITNGKRNDWVEKQIKAIKQLKIPHYEIIVCGTYFDRKEPNFRYINFNKKDDLGWITKKKNLICENARYENIVVMHDKFILQPNWYDGMKKYGNYFNVLSNIILDESGKRAGDWMTYGTKWNKLSRVALLEYNDWDNHTYLDGGYYVLKKDMWRKVKWDESLFWNQGEDLKLSSEFHKNGFVPRFNQYSTCKTLLWRHGYGGIYKFNKYKLGRITHRSKKYYFWYIKQLIKRHLLRRK